MDSADAPEMSRLSRVFESNRWSVSIQIFADGNGGWSLAITDPRGHSTCWTESFTTDQEALDVAVSAIANEGIESFIGPDSEMAWRFDA